MFLLLIKRPSIETFNRRVIYVVIHSLSFAFVCLLSIHIQRGCTSLIYAADNGNIEVATFLIHRGTDIELKNNVSLLKMDDRLTESCREWMAAFDVDFDICIDIHICINIWIDIDIDLSTSGIFIHECVRFSFEI